MPRAGALNLSSGSTASRPVVRFWLFGEANSKREGKMPSKALH